MQQNELLPRCRLQRQQQPLVLADARVIAHAHDHHAVRLADARLRPRAAYGRVRDVQHDAELLLLLREPPRRLELPHSCERVPPEVVGYGRLVEECGWGTNSFERSVQLAREGLDRDATRDGENGDVLEIDVAAGALCDHVLVRGVDCGADTGSDHAQESEAQHRQQGRGRRYEYTY